MFDLPPEDSARAPAAIVGTVCPAEARSLARRVQCGFLRVPLDRRDPDGRTIRVYFEHYRKTSRRPRASTIVSIEGGPGYPTAADRAARVALWRPFSTRRDLVLVDLRGTGRSGALGCQAFARSSRGYVARAGRCAAQVGPRRDFYSTSQAVQDLEAVLASLDAGPVDLYGDSYGSYAAQAFALRYPARLRSLVLDSTYPLPGTDPAWADLVDAIRRGLRLSCERRPSCPAAGEDPVSLVSQFARRLRGGPIVGRAPDGDGTSTRVRLNEDALVQAASSGYWHPGMWRDLLAAIEAANRLDPKPILRLAAETVTVDAGPQSPPESSEALYLAVICHDYPQLWSPATPLAGRRAEANARIAAYPTGTFDPFSAAAWTGTEYEGVFACLRWPSPAFADAPDPPGASYPPVPTLVLNGDLDTITASSGAQEVARRFPNSHFVELRNSIHVLALYDKDGCASRIYVEFVRTLEPGDTSCAAGIPEARVVPVFPRALAGVRPASRRDGDRSRMRDRRLAAAAAATIADVVARWWVNYDGTSVGLRGGTWSYRGEDPVVFRLRRVQFVPGVRVTGAARWRIGRRAVTARVNVSGGRVRGRLWIRWSTGEPLAQATITGLVDRRRLLATMLAP